MVGIHGIHGITVRFVDYQIYFRILEGFGEVDPEYTLKTIESVDYFLLL